MGKNMYAKFVLWVLLVLCFFLQQGHAKDVRPNIIIIIVDDMGYSDLGSFGSEISTPHLDSLAQEGIRFRQFYNGGKCEPTRTILMSGQYWHDAGMKIVRGPTLGHLMQKAGYRTYALGKWHLNGNPVERGFDRYFGHLGGATDFFRGDKSFRLDMKPWPRPKNFYATKAYTDFAIEFIREGKKHHPDQPFFMYLAHSAPHAPLHALPEDIEKFAQRYQDGWDKLRRQRIERQQQLGIIDKRWPIPKRPNTIPAWSELSPEVQAFEAKRMAIYAAMIYRVDAEVGRLLKALDAFDERDNTLIFFLSDNGASPFDRARRGELGKAGSHFNTGLGWAWFSNTPYRFYKRTQHLGGTATGLIANWPQGIPEPLNGTLNDKPHHIIDLMTTMLDLSGGDYPKSFENKKLRTPPGISLSPALKGENNQARDPLYFHLFNHWGIIENNMKLVSAWGRPMELYDLSVDRAEVNNLVDQNSKVTESLHDKWRQWAKQRNIKLGSRGDEPVYGFDGRKSKKTKKRN